MKTIRSGVTVCILCSTCKLCTAIRLNLFLQCFYKEINNYIIIYSDSIIESNENMGYILAKITVYYRQRRSADENLIRR